MLSFHRLQAYRLVPIVLLVGLTTGAGKVYRWVDANGRAHYGDAPPAAVQTQELAPAVKAPKAEDDDAKNDARKSEDQAAQACQQAKDTLANYTRAAKVTQMDATGASRELTDAERQKLLDAEQAKIVKNCPPDSPKS